MDAARLVVVAVDGASPGELERILDTLPARPTPCRGLTLVGGGPSESDPALVSLSTGRTVAATGVPTQVPFDPSHSGPRAHWFAASLLAPTLFDAGHAQGRATAAIRWPATAGAPIHWCLPLVEQLRDYPDRWAMTLATSSPRMAQGHLAPRRDAGVRLGAVPKDAFAAEITAEVVRTHRVDLLALRLADLSEARRRDGVDSPGVRRAVGDLATHLEQVLTAVRPTPEDVVAVLPGRPLVPVTHLVHPNVALADAGLLRTDGTGLASWSTLVWPDGPHGALHVRRDLPEALREAAVDTLFALARRAPVRVRPVDDGLGATVDTDVIAVIDGDLGTVIGGSATQREIVSGEDPYYAGPRAVADAEAPVGVLLGGQAADRIVGPQSWASLGRALATVAGLPMGPSTQVSAAPGQGVPHPVPQPARP
ncbi:alkaline phosphatase family protein [Brachybacterium sp. EF45031]|uniref:alkaline phosphatase family protein n=1 Tax=Brachybacterium sillae TaxID=2810536 RepID=UPI00217D2BEC|nr:alkaline phosphatase family protein [Brachybacterium sillae]MCS6711572.1 alkaline phosphatase family protein [Brachybacterium sillae]